MTAVLFLVVLFIGLRLGTHVLDKGYTFDEQWITIPITDLIEKGWSIDTAIDFQETKGPVAFWPYAIIGSLIGGELNNLRAISGVFFILGCAILLLLARQSGVKCSSLLLIAIMYALLPQNVVLGQLLMSEPLFICLAALLVVALMWGIGSEGHEHRIMGPIFLFLILSAMLHHRVQAVAFSGAVTLVTFERYRWRSWPWVLACLLAGLSRIPLWIRWGGLVASDFQDFHHLGIGHESVSYLFAASVPYVLLLLSIAFLDNNSRPYRWMIWVGAGAGLMLAIFAVPSLREVISSGTHESRRYQGLVESGARMVGGLISSSMWPSQLIIGTMTVAGGASLGALAAVSWKHDITSSKGVILRLTFWTFACGIAFYSLSSGFTFDRYVLPWAILFPIVWVVILPKKWLWIQILMLVPVLAWFVYQWLW